MMKYPSNNFNAIEIYNVLVLLKENCNYYNENTSFKYFLNSIIFQRL